MNDALLMTLLWFGGPAVVFGIFVVALQSIGAWPRWVSLWQQRRATIPRRATSRGRHKE